MPPLRVHPAKEPAPAPAAPRPMPRLNVATLPTTRQFKILQSRSAPAQLTLALRREV